MATDQQYASSSIITCSPEVGGTAVCNRDGKCSGCTRATLYENSDLFKLRMHGRSSK